MADILLSFLALVLQVCAHRSHGFTADLIHRDSPASPFYRPSQSSLTDAARRSHSRAAYLSSKHHHSLITPAKKFVPPNLAPLMGEYTMKISLGTPPVETFLLVDTGSDLTWTQCLPCTNCFPQNTPLFDPTRSSSYNPLPCNSSFCPFTHDFYCEDPNNTSSSRSSCRYLTGYIGKTYTVGDVATETLSLGGLSFPDFLFGCGHNNTDPGFQGAASGIVGLSLAPISVLRQLRTQVAGKFAYCFSSSPNISSRIAFGPDAVIADPKGIVSTPFESTIGIFGYWLRLETLSVGNKRLLLEKPVQTWFGNATIIADSGTYFTYLPRELYGALEEEIKNVIGRTPTTKNAYGQLCYNETWVQEGQQRPRIVAHFTGNADVELSPKGVYEEWGDGLVCLTLVSETDDISVPIFGVKSQVDYVLYYDFQDDNRMTVSFKASHEQCATF